MKICLQAGHDNIKNNCDVSLRSGTGAGDEVAINRAVRNTVAELLTDRGISVRCVDANYNCDSTSTDIDYDLFLSLHCDMDYANDGGSGFCDFPEPSTDGAKEESQRIAKTIESLFFPAVGINIKSRSNANTRYYYMWKFLSTKTPCVLIEMGQVNDPHDKPILQDTEKVSKALANAILISLGQDPLDSEPTSDIYTAEIEELKQKLNEIRLGRNEWRSKAKEYMKELEFKNALIDSLTQDLDKSKSTITTLQNAIQSNKTPLSAYTSKEKLVSIWKEIWS